MKKTSYTVTLNFFVPEEVVGNLREVRVSGPVAFDWRNPRSAHCTVKAIYHGAEIPDEKVIGEWVERSKNILSSQKSFEASVEGLEKWPTVLVSKVRSEEVLKIHRKCLGVLPGSQPEFEGDHYCPHVSIAVGGEELKFDLPKRGNFGQFKVDEIQLMLWGMRDLKEPRVIHRFQLGN